MFDDAMAAVTVKLRELKLERGAAEADYKAEPCGPVRGIKANRINDLNTRIIQTETAVAILARSAAGGCKRGQGQGDVVGGSHRPEGDQDAAVGDLGAIGSTTLGQGED